MPSWVKVPLKKLAKWIVQHGLDELQKEVDKKIDPRS